LEIGLVLEVLDWNWKCWKCFVQLELEVLVWYWIGNWNGVGLMLGWGYNIIIIFFISGRKSWVAWRRGAGGRASTQSVSVLVDFLKISAGLCSLGNFKICIGMNSWISSVIFSELIIYAFLFLLNFENFSRTLFFHEF
jgi:hypothetical protein